MNVGWISCSSATASNNSAISLPVVHRLDFAAARRRACVRRLRDDALRSDCVDGPPGRSTRSLREVRDRFLHREARERPREADLVAAELTVSRPQTSLRQAAEQLLGQLDEVVVVGVRLVELEHRELGVVLRRDPFVAEVAVDLVDARQPADDQPLQVKLRRDAHEEVDVERVVMRDERPRRGAARRSAASSASPLR